ncbi:MAG: L,D-transpeptidase [Oscillospiraceae bacterium]|nr:L,D-transpeptidase [Oscillospiraceae bacterium]
MSHKKESGGLRSMEIILGVVITLAVAITVLLAVQTVDKSRFDRGSSIAGLDVAGLEAYEAAALLDEALDQRSVRITNGEGELMGEAALMTLLGETDLTAATESFLQQQNESGEKSFSPALLNEGLETRLEAILCGEDFVAEAPQNAEFILDEEGARIQPETRGNIPDLPRCTQIITELLDGQLDLADERHIWELRIDDPYVKAEITSDDKALNAQLDALGPYLETEIELVFCGGRRHTMTPGEIVRSLKVDLNGADTTAAIDETGLETVLAEIIEAEGADGLDAKYGNTADTRDYLYLVASDTGYKLDRSKLTLETAAALESCQSTEIVGSYDYTWWLWKTYGWMGNVDNCVEISVDNQYVWLYIDGQLVTETEVVTGDVATVCDTPKGAFRVSYKTTDTYLQGATWYDHVDYWIPYFGNYGIHDSDWRDEYGGDIYLTSGSHGCVNTPLEPMCIIYEHAYVGVPVSVR